MSQFAPSSSVNTSHTKLNPGFTLIEVLVSLALCALLATSTASAIAFAARAEQFAHREGEASLILQSLYAAQRLRPHTLLVVPHGWRVDPTTEIVKLPSEILLERYVITVHSADHEISSFTLRLLDDTP